MARQLTVDLVADASKLSKTFDAVAADSKTMAGKVDTQAGNVRRSFDKMGDGADASEGKFQGMADVLDGLGGAFGLPTEKATGMMRSFGDLTGGFAQLQPLIGTVSGALKTQLGGALSFIAAHPIILAVGLLIAAFVLLWTHSETFRDIVTGAFNKIWEVAEPIFNSVKSVIEGVFNWVKDNWPLLLAIITGPIGLAVLAITTHWDTIKNAFTTVKDWIGEKISDIVSFITGIPGRIAGTVATMWDGIKTAFTVVKDWLWDRLSDVVGFYTGMPGRIAAAAAGMFDGVKDAFKGAINWIIRAWNNLEFKVPSIDLPGPLGKVGGFTLGLADIPELHGGGVVPGPAGADVLTMLRAGERVTPAGAAGGTVVNITVNGALDPTAVGRQIISLIQTEIRLSGALGLR
jgi:phage-related protein